MEYAKIIQKNSVTETLLAMPLMVEQFVPERCLKTVEIRKRISQLKHQGYDFTTKTSPDVSGTFIIRLA